MRTVAIWGTSLVLSSIRASLEHLAGLRVLSFDAAMSGTAERLSALHPDAIIFDLGSKSDSAVALWKAQPDVQLIGVDVAADRALVLSGRSSHVLTIDDLVQIVEEREPLETRE